MERSITPFIKNDLNKKIVFITGPRQVGKTTISKALFPSYEYFNYDYAEHRLILKEASWDRKKPLVVFDELHKMHHWKRWLKGIYDTQGIQPQILVTGSAKLNTYKKVGDSLAGRYFQFRLYPLDLKEVKAYYSAEEAFARLWQCSGFPEPFINGDETYYKRWKRSHTDIILRQDLLDLETVRDIQAIETLLELLKNNVGSPVSYANLARTLEKDAKTIKRWLQLLEELYLIFKVTPYSKKISRSLLKEPKYYFFDSACIPDPGARLENLVANALLKEQHYHEDIYGVSSKLHYLRTRDSKEIDFLLVIDEQPICMLEVKWSDDTLNKNFFYFDNFFGPETKKIQLVKELRREKTYANGIEVRDLISWLYNLNLKDYY
ncbi:ATP-binding protein [soil metagenome]